MVALLAPGVVKATGLGEVLAALGEVGAGLGVGARTAAELADALVGALAGADVGALVAAAGAGAGGFKAASMGAGAGASVPGLVKSAFEASSTKMTYSSNPRTFIRMTVEVWYCCVKEQAGYISTGQWSQRYGMQARRAV